MSHEIVSFIMRYKLENFIAEVTIIKFNDKVYSLQWHPKRLNSTIRTLWLVTNSLINSLLVKLLMKK